MDKLLKRFSEQASVAVMARLGLQRAIGAEWVIDPLHDKPWLVCAKPPFGGADAGYACLGRYTHRIAVSHARLLNVIEREVTLRTRGEASATMPPGVFVARFLDEVNGMRCPEDCCTSGMSLCADIAHVFCQGI